MEFEPVSIGPVKVVVRNMVIIPIPIEKWVYKILVFGTSFYKKDPIQCLDLIMIILVEMEILISPMESF